jgi:phosphatidate phosphatase APP1
LEFLTDLIKYPFRKAFATLKKKLGWLGHPVLLPYRGFGNAQQIYIKGRVIEDSGLAQPDEDTNIWLNMLAMFKRFASSGIAEVEVKLHFKGMEAATVTNENGFFIFELDINGKSLGVLKEWEEIDFEMQAGYKGKIYTQQTTGEVLFCHDKEFGVISDIDDTILISHSTNLRKKLRLMLLKNALTRLPFDGVKSFYRALSIGKERKECGNPIFYVSSSEWNLYDLLVDFCTYQDIPKGPFQLREVKINFSKLWKSGQGNHNHKLDKIRRIMDLYPEMEFLLIGDSGQHDAELYHQIALEYKGRVKTIYIRDVSRSRNDDVQAIAEQLRAEGIEMLLVKDTEAAALHAVQNGYISPDDIPSIDAEKRANQQAKTDLELVEEISSQKDPTP